MKLSEVIENVNKNYFFQNFDDNLPLLILEDLKEFKPENLVKLSDFLFIFYIEDIKYFISEDGLYESNENINDRN